MMNQEETLRAVQLTQVEILEKFSKFCVANHLSYQIFAGTLLGAVRHNGFIPWDDDIDLAMPRKDYEKLLTIWEDSSDYFLQNYRTDKEFHQQFSRIRKNHTLFKQSGYQDMNIHHGIFIDIFPLDDYNPGKTAEKFRIFIIKLLRYINLARVKSKRTEQKLSNKLLWGILNIPNIFIFKSSFDKYYQKWIVGRQSDALYYKHLTDVIGSGGYHRFQISKKDFYDTIELEFEGSTYPAPRKYDQYLTRIYGDYMKLPAKDQRKPHHGIIELKL